MVLPTGWKEYFSDRANAPYYVNLLTSSTQWERPTLIDDEIHTNKKLKVEDSAEAVKASDEQIESLKNEYEAKIAALNKKIVDLSARGSVAAGHNAQHGHINMFSTNEEPLPPAPTIIETHGESSVEKWLRKELMVNDVLTAIFRDEVCITKDGERVKFVDGVDPLEGKHLYNIIKENPGFKRSVEIGCACGTSALYLCQALLDGNRVAQGGFHVSIDPNQDTQYKSIARTNLNRAGLDGHFRLMHEPNYLALGQLLREVRTGEIPGRFHLVFVDGWHTFDYTLLDLFYADLLCEVGGVICLDDINHEGVKKALKFVRQNYTHLKLVPTTPASGSMATFIKTADDERAWNHYKNF